MNGATTIQERLKDLRLNKGLKLEELAEQTGISKSALGSYEKDDYKEINHGNLILLADFYGVSLDYLFCRTENRAEINTPLRELHLSDEMVALQPVLVPQGTVQRQTHELAIIVVDDGNRIFKRIACADGAAHRLLQSLQVVIDLDLLRILSRCNFQHRQSVLVLFHYRPP